MEQRGSTCLELKPGATAIAGGGIETATTATTAAAGTPFPPNVEIARGYSDPAAHAVAEHMCAHSALRVPGAETIPLEEKVGALRISANGWEGFVLDGFLPLIRRQLPPVIAIEWNPAAMKAVGYDSPLAMLSVLSSLGYDDISHSGFICDERWYAVTYGVRRRGGQRPEDQAGLRQPTWCRLLPEDHSLLLEKANSKYPETLLFINRTSGKSRRKSSTTTTTTTTSPSDDAASTDNNINKTKSGGAGTGSASATAADVVDVVHDENILTGPGQEIG
jgi:hypothetical protein